MHHIYYSKEKFIETGGKAVFIIYHLPKMEGAKRMSEQTYMYEQETAVAALHKVEGFDPRKFMRLILYWGWDGNSHMPAGYIGIQGMWSIPGFIWRPSRVILCATRSRMAVG